MLSWARTSGVSRELSDKSWPESYEATEELDDEETFLSELSNEHTSLLNFQDKHDSTHSNGGFGTGGYIQVEESKLGSHFSATTGEWSKSSPDAGDYVKVDESRLEWVGLDLDVYGAAAYSIIHDSIELKTASSSDDIAWPQHLFRVLFSCVGLLINTGLQVSVLYFSWQYAVLPSVREAQVTYRDYHAKCFEKDGSLNTTKWKAWPEERKVQLCNLVFANSTFLYVIIVLWWMTMLHDIRECERLWRTIYNLAHSETIQGIVKQCDLNVSTDGRSSGKTRIVSLPLPVRTSIYILVLIPKTTISLILMITGTMWLASTKAVPDLILNAVALQFVVEIDRTLFDALFPHSIRRSIEKARIAHLAPEVAVAYGYLRSFFYLLLCFGGVVLYLSPLGQSLPYVSVLPNYQHDAHCPVWWNEQSTRICDIPALGECFPFGE